MITCKPPSELVKNFIRPLIHDDDDDDDATSPSMLNLNGQACRRRCIRAVVVALHPHRSHRPHRGDDQIVHSIVARSFVAHTARSRPSAIVARRQGRPPADEEDDDNGVTTTTTSSTIGSSSSAVQEISSTTRSARREIFNQLRYLQDPVRLANRVRILLRDGNLDQAMELVRAASKTIPCTVSWNHLINYQMYEGKVKAALKTYNEVRGIRSECENPLDETKVQEKEMMLMVDPCQMKKRGQTPDAHTYTLLLRGLAEHAHHPLAHGKALLIFQSMFAPNAPVRPSIIHTNAVLKVCTRAQAMDSIWMIAGKMPGSGSGAPDSWTWTTIINALRQDATTQPPPLPPSQPAPPHPTDDRSAKREQAIVDGRRMWVDIIHRWRKGELTIDEPLVCAIGRLLLIGRRPKDWEDVFSLMEQTMNISVLTPRLGKEASSPSPPTSSSSLSSLSSSSSSSEDDAETRSQPDDSRMEEAHRAFDSRVGTSMDHHPSSRWTQMDTVAYIRPSHNTLSLILETCIQLRNKKAGTAYWELLTDPSSYDVRPDSDNYHTYLRLLRIMRASRESVETVEEMAGRPSRTGQRMMAAKTFLIAMSTCRRDGLNRHRLSHAGRVLELMQANLADPSIKVMDMYLDMVIAAPDIPARRLALKKLEPVVSNARGLIAYGRARDAKRTDQATRAEMVFFVRRLVGAYGHLLGLRDQWSRHDWRDLKIERDRLSLYLEKHPLDAPSPLHPLEGNTRRARLTPRAIREDDDDQISDGDEIERSSTAEELTSHPT